MIMTRKRLNLLNSYAAFMLTIILVRFLLLKAAPLHEYTEIDQYTGCYYNYHHYNEGDRIITNEPCLNCTCHNKMLMCYLRVCPFTKPISHECTVEKREDQCCPIITCPEVPVDIDQQLTEFSHSLQVNEKFGCSVGGKLYPQGAQVPSNPNKPCELCYCIKNRTSCLVQECTLHIESCTPIYNRGSCCPVRYNCDQENNALELEDHSDVITRYTTERTTPGFILTTTTLPQKSFECSHNGKLHPDGMRIYRKNSCENCYCMHGDIICAVQECNQPMLSDNGVLCQALPSDNTECCPKNYICDQNFTKSYGDRDREGTTLSYPAARNSTETFALVDKMHDSISQDDMKLQTHIEIDEDTTFQTEFPLQFSAKVNDKVTRLINKNFEDLNANKKLTTLGEHSTKVYPSYSVINDEIFTANTERYTTETVNEENFPQQSTVYNLREEYSSKSRIEKPLSEKQIKEQLPHTNTKSLIEGSVHLSNTGSTADSKYYTIIPNQYSMIQEYTEVMGKGESLATTESSLIDQTIAYDMFTKGSPLITKMEIDNSNDSKKNEIFEGIEGPEIFTTTTNINILTKLNENVSDANINLPNDLEYFDNEIAETSVIPKSDAIIDTHEMQDLIDRNQINNEQLLTKSIETQTEPTTDSHLSEEMASTQNYKFNEYTTTETASGKNFDMKEMNKIPSGKKTFKIASFNSELLNEEIYFDAQILTSTMPNNLIFSENMEKYTPSKIYVPEQTTTYNKENTEDTVEIGNDLTFKFDENSNVPLVVTIYTTAQTNNYKGETYSPEPAIMDITSTVSYDEDKNNFKQFIDLSYKKHPLDFKEILSEDLNSTTIMNENQAVTLKDPFFDSEKRYDVYKKIPTVNEFQKEPELIQTSHRDTGFTTLFAHHKAQRNNETEQYFITTESPSDDWNTLYNIPEEDLTSAIEGLKEDLFETLSTTTSTDQKILKEPFKAVILKKDNHDFGSSEKFSKEAETTYLNTSDKLITKTIIKNTVHSRNNSDIFNENIPHLIPGEGSCLIGEKTIENNSTIPTPSHCNISCKCINSIVLCEHVKCHIPFHVESCILSNTSFVNCCPIYICEMFKTNKTTHSEVEVEVFQSSESKTNNIEDNENEEERLHTTYRNLQESTELNYKEVFTEANIPEVLFVDYEEYLPSNISIKRTKNTEKETVSSHLHVPLLNHSNIVYSNDTKPHVYNLKSINDKELPLHITSSLSSSSFTTSSEETFDELLEMTTDKPMSFKHFILSTAPAQFQKTDPNEKKGTTESQMLSLTNTKQFTTEYVEPTVAQYITEKYFNEEHHTSTQSEELIKNDKPTSTVDKAFKKPSDLITTDSFNNDIPNYTTFMYTREMLETSRGEKDIVTVTTPNILIEMDETIKSDNDIQSYVIKGEELDDFNNQYIKLTTKSTPTVKDMVEEISKNISQIFLTMAPDSEFTTTTILLPISDEMETRKHLSTYNFEKKDNEFTKMNSVDTATTDFDNGNIKRTNSIELNNFDENDIADVRETSVNENQFVTVTSTGAKVNKKSNVLVDLITEDTTKNIKTTILPSVEYTGGAATTVKAISKIDFNDNYLFAQSTLNKYDDKPIMMHKNLEEMNNATSSSDIKHTTENSIVTTTLSSPIKIPENITESFFSQMNHYDNFHKPEQISIPVERIANETGYPITTTVTSTQTTIPSINPSLTQTKSTSTTAAYHANSDNYQQQLPIYAQPPQYPSYPDDDYTEEDETEIFGPGTCRYGGKLYVSAQQIPRDDPCDFCFCFRSDIICLQQSCPPPISGCHEEPIVGFCCPRYECPISIAGGFNLTLESTTTSTTLTPSFPYFTNTKNVQRLGCMINDRSYNVGERIESTSGPCINCLCGGDGNMKCHPQACVPEPTMQQVMAAVAAGRKR